MADDRIALSRFMSFVLRHQPEVIGLELDAHGWAAVDELIAKSNAAGRGLTRRLVEDIVATSDKQRFKLSDDGERIRANQGHSRDVDLGLIPTSPPDVLFHGTGERNVASIRLKGLVAGSRQHVHLSPDRETAIKVGQRHGRPVVIDVDCAGMVAQGHVFYRSDNGVWLTDAVPARFLSFPGDAS